MTNRILAILGAVCLGTGLGGHAGMPLNLLIGFGIGILGYMIGYIADRVR